MKLLSLFREALKPSLEALRCVLVGRWVISWLA